MNAYDAKTQGTPAKELSPIAWRWVLGLVGLKLLVHLITSGYYGYFRDELYYLDCARHLMWGYVDDTPGIVWVFRLALVFGGSLPVVRLLAALGGAGTVLLSSLLARELGGGCFAQVFAGLCVLAAPVFLAFTSVLCVGSFEPLFWIGCVLLVVRIARTGKSRLWWWFGVVAGLGLEMKYTMGLVLAVFVRCPALLTPLRRELRRPAFWGGLAVMALLFAPTLLWQVRHHFPLLTAMETIRRDGKNVVLPPLAFILQQVSILNFTLLPYWLAGLASLLFFRGPNLEDARLVLPLLARSHDRAPREGLLPGGNLSHALFGGWDGFGTSLRPLALDCLPRLAEGSRVSPCIRDVRDRRSRGAAFPVPAAALGLPSCPGCQASKDGG